GTPGTVCMGRYLGIAVDDTAIKMKITGPDPLCKTGHKVGSAPGS
ncbi:MAG: hypothetical protein JWQ57_3510, partial [Mucilaginibacter sp.]|nr:hypothetical protein [Mucilaginibacter sp.]